MKNDIMNLVSKIRYHTCYNIFETASKNRIPYVVVKGEPLSLMAYGKTGERLSGDIDILVPRKEIQAFTEILSDNQFQSRELDREDRIIMGSFSHQTSPWIKDSVLGLICIDVNYDIFWGEYSGRRIDIEEFIEDRVEVDIYGCRISTLPPLKAFIQLILHHYKEMNSLYHLSTHNCINKNMFQDVYCLWKNNRSIITLEKLKDFVFEYGIEPYVFYVLCFTNRIYEDDLLKQYVEAFRTGQGVALLECYGLTMKERREWKYDFETRLNTDNLYDLIYEELTSTDIGKIERCRKIFG